MLRYERSGDGRHRWAGEYHGRAVEVAVFFYSRRWQWFVAIDSDTDRRARETSYQRSCCDELSAIRAVFAMLRKMTRDPRRRADAQR